jgi:hypothetical protein
MANGREKAATVHVITRYDAGDNGLMKRVRSVATAINKAHVALHVLVVDSIVHACAHGDTRPLTAVYEKGLARLPNIRTSLKQYFRLMFKEHPEMECITFEKNEFRMITEGDKDALKEARDRLLKYAEETLINGKPFYETDNAERAAQILGDKRLIQQFNNLVSRAMGENENTISEVHPKLREILGKTKEQIDQAAQFLDFDEDEAGDEGEGEKGRKAA